MLDKFSDYCNVLKECRIQEDVLLEASLSRIHKFIKEGRDFGFITAFRGGINKKENLARNKELEKAFRKEGYGFTKMEGHYIENFGSENAEDVKEQVLFVVGKDGENGNLKGLIKKLGRKYDQDSIFYKPQNNDEGYLIGTNSSGYSGLDKEVKVGKWKPNKAGEFYSKMKGKSFVFECTINEPQGFLGKWAKSVTEHIA